MVQLQGDAWHQEQRRKSQDLIRVYNPTTQDYILMWENERFIVPNKDKDTGYGKGMRVMQRYLAQKYVKEIVDKIILQNADMKLFEIKEKLEKQGNTDPTYFANEQLLHAQGMRTDDPTTRQPIEDQVWLGIEEEFGMDIDKVEIQEQNPMTQYVDPFERLKDKRYVTEELKTPEVITEAPTMEEKPRRGRPPMKHDLSAVAEKVGEV